MKDQDRMLETISQQSTGERSIAAWEIASVVSSLLIAEWATLALFGSGKLIVAIPVILAFGLMLVSHRLRAETLRDIGIRLDNFASATSKLAIPTIAAAILIVGTGWALHCLRFGLVAERPRYLLLPVWAFAQQYVIQGFINRRAQLIFAKGWKSVLIVAFVFGLLHLPNTGLALLTFLAGGWWAGAYQRTPNLFALALSHSILVVLLALSLPPAWLNSLRVGFKYFG
jgi:membrane protease YdiL (CAAX protease family)